MLMIASISTKGSPKRAKSRITLITPALLKSALVIISTSKIKRPTQILFEIWLQIFLGVLGSVNPQRIVIIPKCRKLTIDGTPIAATTRGKKAVANVNSTKMELLTVYLEELKFCSYIYLLIAALKILSWNCSKNRPLASQSNTSFTLLCPS